MYNAAVLTISDKGASGKREDTSGELAAAMLREHLPLSNLIRRIVPDERPKIEETLRSWADREGVQLIVTSGGTGISPRDVTPQATQAVVDYEVPGLAELMRAASFQKTLMAALSRSVVGVRGRTLIVNLPGSPKGVRECLDAILPVLPHALEQLLSGGGHPK